MDPDEVVTWVGPIGLHLGYRILRQDTVYS